MGAIHISGNRAYQMLACIYAGCTLAGFEYGKYCRWEGTQEQYTNADAQERHFEEQGVYDRRLMDGYSPTDEI